jgi:hypothetical protein
MTMPPQFRRRKETLVAVVLAAVTAVLASAAPAADGAHERPVKLLEIHRQQETPDDPPGIPAPVSPGARAAAPMQMGIATTWQVNVDAFGANIVGDAANEPSIAVDPNDPNRIVIGWRQFDTILSNFRQAGFGYSTDNGRTWTVPGPIQPGVFRSDPVLGCDADGVFYYNSLRVSGGGAVYSNQVFRSFDGGATWPVFAPAYGGDKQWMTIDRTGAQGHGHVYCYWSTAAGCCADTTFNRSTDGAASFEYPLYMPNTPVWGQLDVDRDGRLYIAGVDPESAPIFWLLRSSNARDAAATPSFDQVTQFILGGYIRFGNGAGDPNPGGLLGQVSLAVDRSGGPNDGNIYAACSLRPGSGTDPLDVYFARSTDGGQTFSPGVRINDDPPQPWAWQWFATMSVAPNGRIDIAWNDNRNTVQASLPQLYYTSSSDGGLTWAPNQQLSGTWNSHLGWPDQDKIGDYYDMVSDDVGASLAWAATFNGEQDVYYTRIGGFDCNGNGVADSTDIATGHSADANANEIPDECEGIQTAAKGLPATGWELHPNVPNPFNPTTTIRYVVPAGGADATVRVFDAGGRLVRTLAGGFQEAGAHDVVWNGRDQRGARVASGVYFCRLEAGRVTLTQKMVLLK